MTPRDAASPEGPEGKHADNPDGDGVEEPSGLEADKDKTSAVKGVNRRVIGFALVALGVLNSLFKAKAGLTGTSWLNLILIGAGAIIFFSALRQGRSR